MMSYFANNQMITSMIKRWKLPFISTMIFGFLVHTFVFTNRLPTWDGLRNFYSPEQMDTSGRFFLTYAHGISSYFELPWLNGVLSIVYLAMIVVLIIELFDVKHPLTKVLISAVVVTIPTVTATFAYMYTANGYLLATVLTMLALVISKKYKLGVVFSPLLILIAVGIYQANLAVALSFIVLYLTYLIVFRDQSLELIFKQAVRMLLPVIIGMVLYLIYYKFKTTFGGVDITSYKGLDEAGSLALTDIPERIKYMFEYMFTYFFSDEVNIFNWNLYEIMNFILLLSLAWFALFSFVKLANKAYMIPVLVLLFIGYPFAMFVIIFTSPSVDYHTIMTFSTVVVYLIPLLFLEYLLSLKPNQLRKWMVYATVLFTVILTFNFAIISNIAYMNMEYRTEKTINLLNRIATSIEENPSYVDADRLHVIGQPQLDSSVFEEKVEENVIFIQGTTGRHALKGEVQIVNGLQNYVGMEFKGLSYEERDKINEYQEVKDMKEWPHEDSLLLVDDTLVIKFSEE